jgi:methylation protein EvaC
LEFEGRIAGESQVGLLRHGTYEEFQGEVDRIRTEFNEALANERGLGLSVVGYGASAKGNTAINFFGCSLDYIVDDNPLKHGYLTPGANIPIRPPSALVEDDRDLAIVILSWNFAKEIATKIKALRLDRTHDRAIVYVPEVQSVPIGEAAGAFADISG